MKLADYGEDLAYEIAFWRQGLTALTYPLSELGKLCLEVSHKFRSLAIMVLLVKADTDRFYHNLIRSGMAREAFLQRLRLEAVEEDHHLASGRYDPLLDAIAAGELELARRIANLSPVAWQEGHEYEDDYCFAQILHRFIQNVPPEEEILSFLEQLEVYLDGQLSARLDVGRALLERDQVAFDKAFEALLDERESGISRDIERGQLEEPVIIAQRYVFIEGLAILRLAALRGLSTQLEYQYCPSLARLPMRTPFPGE